MIFRLICEIFERPKFGKVPDFIIFDLNLRSIMKIIAVFNIKGGVGKTATAVNIAYAAAEAKTNTLLVDLDPQGAASFYLQQDQGMEEAKQVIKGERSLEEEIIPTPYEHLFLLPADEKYRKMDVFLKELKNGRSWLKNLFKPVSRQFDLVVIDCPPSITLFSENILSNSDYILVPVVPTTLSIRTYEQLKDFCKESGIDGKKLHPFFSMYERRKNLHNESIAEFASSHKETIDVAIPYVSEIERMGVYRRPFINAHPESDIAYLYRQLWKAIKKNIG